MTSLQCPQAISIEAHFRRLNSDQAQQGSVVVRTRDGAGGARSGVGAGGGAVVLVVELLSGYPTLPEAPPCRRIGSVTKLERGGARRPLRHFAGDSERKG